MKGRPKPLLTQCWTNVISSSLDYDWGCHGGLPGGSHLVAIRVPGGSRIYYHGRWHRNCRETITAFSCLRQAATETLPSPKRETRALTEILHGRLGSLSETLTHPICD